ncbi:hypothetical protein P4472_08885 [Bacillus subtilis]|nr:hypothetical protein [Bacillus subtilis]MED3692455.1 hypothetical protein [Bacillus subtilis]
MEKFNVSKAAVKKATVRLGLSNAQVPNALIKYHKERHSFGHSNQQAEAKPFTTTITKECALLLPRMAPY